MAGFELKEYQRETLGTLERFSAGVREAVQNRAMRPVHDAYYAQTERDFIQVPQLPNVPYVCLRVPTGGGKTLIGAHAVGVVAKHLGHLDRPLCLWVTPTRVIRDQTLNALRNREHPYHAALRDGLGGTPVEILTIEEALSANRSILTSKAVIVVTTIQSYRIDHEANRKVYEDSGYLMDHFANLPSWVPESLAEQNGDNDGTVQLTFANVMKLRGPIVIMDEAHNARTRISFDSLARFEPLGVLELTATPQQDHDPDNDKYASNVLHAVSALQLQSEGMIKLPVELESRDNWLDVLALTVQRRNQLEQQALAWGADAGRYIRPIALIQAQPKSKTRETHTIERVKEALLNKLGTLNVPADHIIDHDVLDKHTLHERDCPVRYIVTVEKLREGWDCPFAYIIGSVGNVSTATAVEQLLGRVLRMPHATPTGVPALDRAYAVVQCEELIETAQNLCDSLVNRCGFDADTVRDAFRIGRHHDAHGQLPVATIPVCEPVNVQQLPDDVRGLVEYVAESGSLHVRQELTREQTISLRDGMSTLADRAAVEEYWQNARAVGTAAKRLDDYAESLRIPQLIVRDGQRSYLFEPEELDEFTWDLDQCSPTLSENEFSIELNVGDRVSLGVAERGGVRIGGVEKVIVRQLSLLSEGGDWSKPELVRWLDNELHRNGTLKGLTIAQSQAWVLRVLDSLCSERKADLRILVRKRHELANVLARKMAAHGRLQVREAANRLINCHSTRTLEASLELPAVLAEQQYRTYRRYHGQFELTKHAFSEIGDMGNEESQCAKRIDDHPNVKRWIRNLEHESAGGFHLPLSPGRFFPDFIAELNDGRIALIEYKGEHLATNSKQQHKEMIGKLWEERSEGRCVFIYVVNRDWATLEVKLNPTA